MNTFHNQDATLDFDEFGRKLRSSYAQAAEGYRRDDDIEITTGHHRHLKGVLGGISESFGRPISVLEAGCGTGRYFYCLKNVERLVGLDVSPEMLKIAENPVRQEDVTAATIELKCGNIHRLDFPAGSFDVIYSLGMFGNGCPVTVELCNRFHHWLAPGGKLFFDAVDTATLPFYWRIRRKIRESVYPILPRKWKMILDERSNRMPLFDLTKNELEQIMSNTRFKEFSVSSRVCESPLWRGVHLECYAAKAQ